jgi:hypothetical protein
MVANPAPALRSTTNPRNVIVEYTRAVIDRVIEQPERVSISEITDDVLKKFANDQAFMTSLAIMNVREIVNAAVRETIAETRGPARRVIVRDTIVTPQEQLAETPALMQALALRWGRFREWNGAVHVLLPKMTRIDLLAAASIRRERAERELAYAVFFERLAARLPDDQMKLEEVVTLAVIDQEYAAARQEIEQGGNGQVAPDTDS